MATPINPQAVVWATQKTGLNAARVMSTLNLLIDQDCTIPFISRYRKEATGGLDEVQIRSIQEEYENFIELEKRKIYVIAEITKQEKLTPALEKMIMACEKINLLEDIYAPFKSKKKTKAQLAKDYGLEPLAQLLLTSYESIDKIATIFGTEYIKTSAGKVKDFNEAIAGACDILIETFAHNIELKEKLREIFWKEGKVISSKKNDAESIKDYDKFQDFFEYTESVKDLNNAKASHRYLALRRGLTLKILKVDVKIDENYAYQLIEALHFNKSDKLSQIEILRKCAKKCYDNVIAPSLDLEIKTELKKVADDASINVFGVNLKNLLLQPYLGAKAVLGIDPGIRTGCKVVIIDETGAFKGDHVIYPFEPKNDVKGSLTILSKMIELFNIQYIAIGNGTFGRETLMLCNQLKEVQSEKVKAVMVNESGASIYSASDIARKEFPDQDVTVRGSVSIARRFQDPLAELVKLDPKSIGVGQYQHDVNQTKLKKSLDSVVEDCVNYVGVDLNTASAPLLSFVSGIGPSVAENLVSYRTKNGKFKSREDLQKIPKFTKKIFEQSAGFLRIYGGDNLLDSTFIHPERYTTLQDWTKKNKITMDALLTDKEVIQKIKNDPSIKELVGEMTLNDIVKSLLAPCQDPRTEFQPVDFAKDIKDLEDIKIGTWYNGVVTNITNFGAFVDIGIKVNGLLHISEISNEFVENALDKLKVGQTVKVKATEVDQSRKRISLSMKADSKAPANIMGGGKKQEFNAPVQQMKNNPFASLKNFKLK